MLALLTLAAKLLWLVAGLIGPGAALMRALAVPRMLSACFAGSAAILYGSVLLLDAVGIRVTAISLTLSLIVASGAALLAARLRGQVPDIERGDWLAALRRMGAWTPLIALVWTALVWRAVHEPLAGPDVEFRWIYLAEQLLAHGSLDFYPPQSASDFREYFWAESIPPGVAALHAWAFACSGSFDSAWTAPVVLMQLWALYDLLWHGADRLGGVRAARLACLAAAACPLLAWSFLLAQETGLTALSLTGMFVALLGWEQTPRVRAGWAALAGVFAVMGASAREYGVIFPLLGAAGLLVIRADRPAWLAFAAAGLLSVAWPLRVALATGNPFYSLRFFGAPINERFVAWIEHDAAAYGAVLLSVEGWTDVARYLIQFAPLAIVGWVVLAPTLLRANAWRRNAVLLLGAIVALVAIWLLSVQYTHGGLFYALRVLSPALALGALACGVALAAIAAPRPKLYHRAVFALGLLVVGTLPATLALPQNPWRTPLRTWPSLLRPAPAPVGLADETVALVMSTGQPGVVAADGPGFQRRFRAVGVTAIPLWSPELDWLFDSSLAEGEAARRWRESGVRHLVVTKWQRNLDFLNAHSRWGRSPFQVRLIGETEHTAVFALSAAP